MNGVERDWTDILEGVCVPITAMEKLALAKDFLAIPLGLFVVIVAAQVATTLRPHSKIAKKTFAIVHTIYTSFCMILNFWFAFEISRNDLLQLDWSTFFVCFWAFSNVAFVITLLLRHFLTLEKVTVRAVVGILPLALVSLVDVIMFGTFAWTSADRHAVRRLSSGQRLPAVFTLHCHPDRCPPCLLPSHHPPWDLLQRSSSVFSCFMKFSFGARGGGALSILSTETKEAPR